MDTSKIEGPAVDIDIADSEETRARIFELRRKVEAGLKNIAGETVVVRDNLDETAVLVYAESEGESHPDTLTPAGRNQSKNIDP